MKCQAKTATVVEAWVLDQFNWSEVARLCDTMSWGRFPNVYMNIKTMGGLAQAFPGDVVAEFPDGSFGVYEPDDFWEQFEEVDS